MKMRSLHWSLAIPSGAPRNRLNVSCYWMCCVLGSPGWGPGGCVRGCWRDGVLVWNNCLITLSVSICWQSQRLVWPYSVLSRRAGASPAPTKQCGEEYGKLMILESTLLCRYVDVAKCLRVLVTQHTRIL